MKKCLVCLLCLSLALLVAPASASDIGASSYTQLDKLVQQLATSGYEGGVSFFLEGDSFLTAEPALWAALKALLPQLTLSSSSTVARGGVRETLLSLKQGENTLTDFSIVKDEAGISYVKSPLFSEDNLYFAFADGLDISALLDAFKQSEGWPSLMAVLLKISGAEDEWQTRAQTASLSYTSKVTAWLQEYAATSTENDVNGNFITTITYQLPAAAVLQETKQLLVDLYSDPTMLALLREVLSAEEQAAYLQPAMLLSFLQMLDNVKLEGEIGVKRQFDFTGKPIYESISLPFASTFPLESLSYISVPTDAGADITLSGSARGSEDTTGAAFLVTLKAGEQDIYTGELSLTPQHQKEAQATPYAFTYQLYMPAAVDVADAFNSRWERSLQATLLLRADEQMKLPPLSITLDSKIYSNSSAISSVTHTDGTIRITDTQSAGSINLAYVGKTTRAWAPTLLTEAQSAAMRIDLMDQAARSALIKQTAENAAAKLQALLNTFLLSLTPSVPATEAPPADGTLG